MTAETDPIKLKCYRMLQPTPEQSVSASQVISDYLDPTPMVLNKELCRRIGTKSYVKCEYISPVRSFKARGALNLVHHLKVSGEASRLSTASTGNHGAAMSFACQEYSLPLTVGVPVNADDTKVSLIKNFGARLEFLGNDLDETKEIMLQDTAFKETLFIEDGSSQDIVAGTSTIGLEIIEQVSGLDMVLVPVGNGALIGGIGTVIKAAKPSIKIIGVQAEEAPCMVLSFRSGEPVDTESCNTFATGMAVRVAIPEAVALVSEVVDEMVLVSEREMKQAMGIYYACTGQMVEGAGAAALSGALKISQALEGKTICLIATGANVDQSLKQEVIDNFI